jgi:beta-lactam-binding protein with PASTA domain
MDISKYFKRDSVKDLLKHFGIVAGILFLLGVTYFYVYLPNATNHGEFVQVPDLKGVKVEDLEKFLNEHKLRYSLNDSSYSDSLPPFSVIRQFPAPGSKVKKNRIIYVSLNRISPPTLPMPDLEGSLLNAKAVLKSSELKLGLIYYKPSPFPTVLEFRYRGVAIAPGLRLAKGSTIDLVVGDGRGPNDFTVGNLVGDSYETALEKLAGWNLHLGKVEIPEGADTTGVTPIVFKQFPNAGDSVRVGFPVDLWIAPKGYKPAEEGDEGTN